MYAVTGFFDQTKDAVQSVRLVVDLQCASWNKPTAIQSEDDRAKKVLIRSIKRAVHKDTIVVSRSQSCCRCCHSKTQLFCQHSQLDHRFSQCRRALCFGERCRLMQPNHAGYSGHPSRVFRGRPCHSRRASDSTSLFGCSLCCHGHLFSGCGNEMSIKK